MFKIIADELSDFKRFSAFFKLKKLMLVAEVEVVWETDIIDENPFVISLILTLYNYTIPPMMLIKGESDSFNGKVLSMMISEISTIEEIDLARIVETFELSEVTFSENKVLEIFKNPANLQKVVFTLVNVISSLDPVI